MKNSDRFINKKIAFILLFISVILNIFLLLNTKTHNKDNDVQRYDLLSKKLYEKNERFILLNEGIIPQENAKSYLATIDFYGNIATVTDLHGHYESLAYDRKNNVLYITSHTSYIRFDKDGYEILNEELDPALKLADTTISFTDNGIRIKTDYCYENDPRLGFNSDYAYWGTIKTESLNELIPVAIALK